MVMRFVLQQQGYNIEIYIHFSHNWNSRMDGIELYGQCLGPLFELRQ